MPTQLKKLSSSLERFLTTHAASLTVLAMLLGVACGLYFGKSTAFLGGVAHGIIQLIKFLAIPFLFLAILDTVLKRTLKGRGVVALVIVFTINGLCAITIALCLSNIFQPGQYLPLAHDTTSAFGASDHDLKSIFLMGLRSPMVLAIALSIVLGFLLPQSFGVSVERLFNRVLRVMGGVVHLVPIAVFASVAKVVGFHGFAFAGGLGVYLGFCLLGMFLHVALVYQTWVFAVARIGFKKFWQNALAPVLHGFGINSSLATLPVTLQCLKRLGISDSSARLSACVGTNFNNDGILLYEVVAVLFLAQAYGHDLTIGAQLATALVCVMATIGVGGIPEAGVIALTLVLSAAQIPQEHLPLLLTVDWIVARTRSAVNVLGDITVAIGIDRLVRR